MSPLHLAIRPLGGEGQEASDRADGAIYRRGGVYVVIGGAGAVGEVWSEYVIRHWQAQVVWIGRRPLDEAIQAKLDRLAALGGPAPLYIAADASDRDTLTQAYGEIKRRFPQVHGVVHAALVFAGGGLAAVEEERFRAVLASKVAVGVRLAQVFADEALDFVLFFSSINAFLKAPGSGAYASGCAFADALAHRLAQAWPAAVKVINWGYWGGIGAAATSEPFQQWLAQSGQGSITPAEAMEALTQFLASPLRQAVLTNVSGPSGLQGLSVDWREAVTFHRPAPLQQARPLPDRDWQSAIQAGVSGHLGAILQRLRADMESQSTALDELLARLLENQLRRMGGPLSPHATADERHAYKITSGLLDAYDRWFDASLTFIAARHRGHTDDVAAAWDEWERRKRVWLKDPARAAHVVLVERTLRALPDILSGRRPATEVIFPEASMGLVQGIYAKNPVADFFNAALADAVIAYIQAWRERRAGAPGGLRILEIGAGTGGTSAMVFRRLQDGHPPYREAVAEYCYTDISRAFLMHAEREFVPTYPYLTCQRFDVEAPIAGQGIAMGAYDLVIAANVLHATRDIRQTLCNVKALLKYHGLLLLSELTRNTLFTHLTFGLLDGWWRYEDGELRLPGCPGLSPQRWQTVLEQEGFRSVLFPVRAAHDLGCQIIAADSDGIVRQRREGTDRAAPPRSAVEATTAERWHAPAAPVADAAYEPQALRERTIAYLKRVVGERLKIPLHRLDASQPLEKYGIDSILVVQMTNALRQVFDGVSSTLFFEHHSIEALAEYFISTQRGRLVTLLGLDQGGLDVGVSPPHPDPLPEGEGIKNPDASRSLLEPIAVIGMGGRFPQCQNVDELWELLASGRSAITRVPAERWTATRPDEWGGFVPDMPCFDPLFFEISPRDAALMDPRQRLFLEEAWHTLEDAGYMGERIRGKRCGVYVGVEEGEYAGLGGDGQVTNNQNAMLPARIAYLLDLKGPNFALTAACSSGLVAVHQACQGLRQGDCDLALAGGASLIMSPLMYSALGKLNLLSPDGRCHAFDRRANGMVIGEAVAAVLLKPLSRAVADGDRIYGCIVASGVNYDGRTNGITVPDPASQAELLRQTYERYGIDPERIQYVMAHSVGSPLGDPVEFQALKRAFRAYTERQAFCALGSIKPQIGHTAAASGVVGLIALLQAMRHQIIPGTQNFEYANADIALADSPFVLHTANTAWGTPARQPRLGAVSTAGISGTNAHVVVEEYLPLMTEQPPAHRADAPRLIVLSARTPERLRAVVRQMLRFVERCGGLSLADLAYTLQAGREAMECRLAMVVRDLQELTLGLHAYLSHQEGHGAVAGDGRPLPLFTGNLDEGRSEMAELLAGGLGDELLRLLLAERHLEKLALYWAKGGKIPWAALHQDGPFQLLALPTYPFARERYWVQDAMVQPSDMKQRTVVEEGGSSWAGEAQGTTTPDAAVTTASDGEFCIDPEQSPVDNLRRYIVRFLCREAGLTPEQVKPGKALRSYGVDSIVGARLRRGVETQFQVKVSGRELLEHRSIEALAAHLAGRIDASHGQVRQRHPEPGNGAQARAEYRDPQVIAALEQLERGTLDLEAVQRLIEG